MQGAIAIRRAIATAALAALAASLVPILRADAETPPPAPPTLVSLGKVAQATLGSTCWKTEGGGQCADAAYPLPVRCKLPVKPGAKLVVRLHRPADSVTATVDKRDGMPGRRLPAWKNRSGNVAGSSLWRFRQTKRLLGAAAIDVFAYFPGGDLDSWTGVKTDACRAGFRPPAP